MKSTGISQSVRMLSLNILNNWMIAFLSWMALANQAFSNISKWSLHSVYKKFIYVTWILKKSMRTGSVILFSKMWFCFQCKNIKSNFLWKVCIEELKKYSMYTKNTKIFLHCNVIVFSSGQ